MRLFKKIKNLFKRKKPKEKPKPEVVKKEKIKKAVPKVEPVKRAVPRKKIKEVYKFLEEPHISEKATQLSDKRKYIFKVYPRANKSQIKKAVSSLYGVKVKDVNIINIKPKKRVLRGIEGAKTGYKKAIVSLEEGHKIEILPH